MLYECVCVCAIFGRIGSSTMEYSKACTKHRTVFKVTHYRTIVGLSSMGDVGNNYTGALSRVSG